MMRTNYIVCFLIGSALVSTDSAAQAVDTSEWVCEFCPFEEGYRGDYEVGATSVSEDSAYLGDATGYDEDGVYADLNGTGAYTTNRHQLRWWFEDLGLDARAFAVDGGSAGKFDYALGYREQPRRRFDSTSSIFSQSSGRLSLPSGWAVAPQTGGFTGLAASNTRRNVESDRDTLSLGGRYLANRRIRFTAEYRRQQNDGVKRFAGPSFTTASELAMPFDYVTDEVEVGARYQGNQGFASVSWYLSDFENDIASLTWENPFTTAPGAEVSLQAQAPDSRMQQLSIAGGYSFPAYRTVLSASVSVGNIEQDDALFPYTTNNMLVTSQLPVTTLDGDIDTTNYAVAFSSRPLDKARIRFSYRYDERDNKTAQVIWDRVITDTFVSGDLEPNIPYSFERSSLSLSGDYDLFSVVRISAGYDRREIDRDFQEVAEQTEDSGWGRIRWQPTATFEVDVRGGASKRDIDAYNESLGVSFGQNPLLRKYNLAYRYREFGELGLTWSPQAAPISFALDALFTDDSYSRSEIGITAGEELSVAFDFSWSVSENASLYLNAGVDQIESQQAGSELFATPDWRAAFDDDFTTISAGLRVRQIAEKWDLQFDVTQSDGESAINVTSAASGADQFPDLTSEFSDIRLALAYRRSERLQFEFDVRYQAFDTDDWSLQDVQAATIPSVLALGARPYDDDTLIAGISVRYRLVTDKD